MLFRLFILTLLSGLVLKAPAQSYDTLSPRRVMERFDSLLNTHEDAEAKSLCTGTALRMFSFLVEAQHKLDPFLDSSKSRDTVIEEKQNGKWCGLKMKSHAVFRKTMMGMDSLDIIQVVQLFKRSDGWKLAEFEQLSSENSPWVLRSGLPSGMDTIPDGSLFPVSHQAPEQRGATRMRLKISLRNGDSLPRLPQGPGQKILKRSRNWALIETMHPPLPDRKSPSSFPDSLTACLGSGTYLDLDDALLLAKAGELRQGAVNDVEISRNIYRFVSSSFHFKLGAALFSKSNEALRSMQGDCSEAAVLTAALFRAEGIPSRVALGFATLGRGVFIGHAWAEVFLNGQWIGVDPALREFPAGAERVMLLRLSGSEDMQVAAANLMLQVVSNLDIEITGAWAGSKPLPLIEQQGNAGEAKEFFEEVLKGIGE